MKLNDRLKKIEAKNIPALMWVALNALPDEKERHWQAFLLCYLANCGAIIQPCERVVAMSESCQSWLVNLTKDELDEKYAELEEELKESGEDYSPYGTPAILWDYFQHIPRCWHKPGAAVHLLEALSNRWDELNGLKPNAVRAILERYAKQHKLA